MRSHGLLTETLTRRQCCSPCTSNCLGVLQPFRDHIVEQLCKRHRKTLNQKNGRDSFQMITDRVSRHVEASRAQPPRSPSAQFFLHGDPHHRNATHSSETHSPVCFCLCCWHGARYHVNLRESTQVQAHVRLERSGSRCVCRQRHSQHHGNKGRCPASTTRDLQGQSTFTRLGEHVKRGKTQGLSVQTRQ